MDFLEWFMPTVWFVILALFLLLYVILDGFDLGVASCRLPQRVRPSAAC